MANNETKMQMLDAMLNLKNAMNILSAVWEKENNDKIALIASEKYPFTSSFADVSSEVADWVNYFEKQIAKI